MEDIKITIKTGGKSNNIEPNGLLQNVNPLSISAVTSIFEVPLSESKGDNKKKIPYLKMTD